MALLLGRDRAAVLLFPPDPPRRALPDHHRQGLSAAPHRSRPLALSRPARSALLLVFLITGVPFLMMLYASLLPFYQAPSVAAFESMSFANYWTLFHNTKTIAPMINSTILGPIVATAVIVDRRADRLFRAQDAACRAARSSTSSASRRSPSRASCWARPSSGSICWCRCRSSARSPSSGSPISPNTCRSRCASCRPR